MYVKAYGIGMEQRDVEYDVIQKHWRCTPVRHLRIVANKKEHTYNTSNGIQWNSRIRFLELESEA